MTLYLFLNKVVLCEAGGIRDGFEGSLESHLACVSSTSFMSFRTYLSKCFLEML